MEMNIMYLFLAALIPMIIGSIWYNPKVMGTAWMKTTGLTEEQLQGGNMFLIFGLSYVLSFFIAFGLLGIVIHQMGVFQLFASHPDAADITLKIKGLIGDLGINYDERHRTFGHGALHGGLAAFTFALPFIGINSLFERKGFKYIGIHFGYWLISLILMGGVICAFL